MVTYCTGRYCACSLLCRSLRCYTDDDIFRRTINRALRADLLGTMGIDAEPLFVEVTTWNESMPQYPVGHLDQLKQFKEKLK